MALKRLRSQSSKKNYKGSVFLNSGECPVSAIGGVSQLTSKFRRSWWRCISMGLYWPERSCTLSYRAGFRYRWLLPTRCGSSGVSVPPSANSTGLGGNTGYCLHRLPQCERDPSFQCPRRSNRDTSHFRPSPRPASARNQAIAAGLPRQGPRELRRGPGFVNYTSFSLGLTHSQRTAPDVRMPTLDSVITGRG